ncbi:biofilm development regulator YmgB/AriR family protein [Pantoea sp. 1.19]|uniref:biofilm development regulator YmgB/AriR family protein n=1 Tax=Pantoea sp. 1.19 TaxID=1925589 RepID=UPI000948CF2F|nr:biofilm development regulator YmgB/AriR family protein [Pantoea sp. 1.19]
MVIPHYDTAREIADYFNSPAFRPPQTAEMLAVIMQELMQRGEPATDQAMIASVLKRLEREVDAATLRGYRALLAQLLRQQQD